MRTRIKICGLTRAPDVRCACALGVDAVGFVCHPGSPRFVPVERLAALAGETQPFVTPVLLFVNAAAAQIETALRAVPHAVLQFHGSETAEECERYGRPYLRAVPMAQGVDLLDWQRRFASAAALLADAPSAAFGGSGRTFDWSLLPAPERRTRPLIVAGGLCAANVAGAIRAAQPCGVDVSSGVETQPGLKSEALMREFIAAVRGTEQA